jgi:hypothetical protein
MKHLLVTAMVLAAAAAASCGESSIKIDPPLFVTDTLPANGATTSAADLTVVAIAFSEAIDGGTLKDKVTLSAVSSWSDDGAGTAVAVSLTSVSEDKLTALYAIGVPLTAGQYYRITVKRDGVAAESGNTLAADVHHYFLAQ